MFLQKLFQTRYNFVKTLTFHYSNLNNQKASSCTKEIDLFTVKPRPIYIFYRDNRRFIMVMNMSKITYTLGSKQGGRGDPVNLLLDKSLQRICNNVSNNWRAR